MKKKIALVLIAALTVAALAVGCTKKADDKETTTKKQEQTTTKKEDPTTKKEEPTTEEPTTETPTTPIVEGVVDNADGSQTLGCLAWWTFKGTGKDYALTGNGSITLKIETVDNTRAFSVELYTSNAKDSSIEAGKGYFMTTGSDGNGWFAEALTGTVTSPYATNGNADPGKFSAGNTYEVTITRDGNKYSMEYKDIDKNEVIYTITGEATSEAPEALYVHVMAQVGNITVSQK